MIDKYKLGYYKGLESAWIMYNSIVISVKQPVENWCSWMAKELEQAEKLREDEQK